MKNGIDSWRVLHDKLRMSGVTLVGPTFVYGDNMSVAHTTQCLESVFLKILQTRSVTTQCVSLVLWDNKSLAMCLLLTILMTFALRLCRVGSSGTI
jgi:hypothetical protein